MILLTLPDKSTRRSVPPQVKLADGTTQQTLGWPVDRFAALPDCTMAEAPEPIPPAIPEPIQLLVSQILALWATTKLPPPADWTAARQALRPWVAADPANRNTTLLELLSLRLELSELGGTWAQVLHLAAP